MIQLTPQMRLLVAVEPADFRRGIDGVAQLCRATLLALMHHQEVARDPGAWMPWNYRAALQELTADPGVVTR